MIKSLELLVQRNLWAAALMLWLVGVGLGAIVGALVKNLIAGG